MLKDLFSQVGDNLPERGEISIVHTLTAHSVIIKPPTLLLWKTWWCAEIHSLTLLLIDIPESDLFHASVMAFLDEFTISRCGRSSILICLAAPSPL